MKRNVIVEKLIKEGFSEKTLVKFSDDQLSQLFERVVSEVTTQVATVYNAKDQNDVNALNSLISNPAGLAAAQKKGAVKVQSSEGKKVGELDESLHGIMIASIKDRLTKSLGREPKDREIEREYNKFMDDWKKDVDSKKSKDKKEVKKPSEVKEWVKSLAEENFHNFTSKNEIMELINIKLNESEIQHGPNVKKGHNNVPEFMSYEAITASGPAVAPTKPSPTTKPGTKPGKPKPQTPYQPGIGPKHKPKALGLNEDDIMELDHEELKNSPRFEEFRKALAKNVNVSVAYVKNDGTVRHMLVKRYLSSYVPSEKERTEKQMAINQTHDVKRVIDLNAYNKSLRETGDKELSAKKAWRTINLDNVLGFMVRGNFIDLRDENEIKDRFGEDVHNSLTKSMVSAMQANQAEVAAEVPEMA
jgi:hypothetical protein